MTNNLAILCIASWYSSPHHGMTCASWSFPINSEIRVTERYNGLSVVVRVCEHGPAHRLVKQGVLVDLSKEAFSILDDPVLGHCDVKVERIK
jgi:rare lipoprotein A (peptidoglycan hydrolase)